MKLAYLVEVTALVTAHSRLLIEQPKQISTVLLGDYYVQSRNRFNRWMRDLNDLENGVTIRDPLHLFGLSPQFPPTMSITEQILVNDLLNRVWTVVLISCDVHRGEERIRPLAENVYRSHSVVRHKALSVANDDVAINPDQMLHLNRLRAASERWADLLNCALMAEYDLWNYAFDPMRAQEFFEDRCGGTRPESSDSGFWPLVLAGLRKSFPDIDGLSSPLHDDDRMITRSIMDCFPCDSQSLAPWTDEAIRG